jgi:hypothetical protein
VPNRRSLKARRFSNRINAGTLVRFAVALTRSTSPGHAEGMEPEGILNRQLIRVADNFIGVINQRIDRDTPGLMPNNPLAVLAGLLRIVAVADVPDSLAVVGHLNPLSLGCNEVAVNTRLRSEFIVAPVAFPTYSQRHM